MFADEGRGNILYKLTMAGLRVTLMLLSVATVLILSGDASAASPTGSISGTVFTNAGLTPVEGAVIFVNDFRTGAAAGNATSGADGTYVISGLTTGGLPRAG